MRAALLLESAESTAAKPKGLVVRIWDRKADRELPRAEWDDRPTVVPKENAVTWERDQ